MKGTVTNEKYRTPTTYKDVRNKNWNWKLTKLLDTLNLVHGSYKFIKSQMETEGNNGNKE